MGKNLLKPITNYNITNYVDYVFNLIPENLLKYKLTLDLTYIWLYIVCGGAECRYYKLETVLKIYIGKYL